MGKIRIAALGDESESEQKRRAEARRQTKKSKKEKVEGVGLKGGERVAVVEGGEINPEFKKLVEEVESGETVQSAKTKKAKEAKVKVRSGRYQIAAKLVDKTKTYALGEAIDLVKKTSTTKFDGTVELHLNLNPAVMGDKKDFRTTVSLPHGTGKEIKVAIADDALISKIESGKIDFDVLVAHPQMMAKLARVAKILGPKGLMPNPKNGTIGENPEKLAAGFSKGQINLKTEPDNPLLHVGVGKVSFENQKLKENIEAIWEAVGKNKIGKATLTSTMGPGIKVTVI